MEVIISVVDQPKNNQLGDCCENLAILIPTYNCANYLRETLKSLQQQGDFISKAHIEIIDDFSTKDDPAAVAEELWPGRVSFYRQPKNVGAVENFNTCLQRTQRQWVHILHGDDIVLPGAYKEFDECIKSVPNALAVFARSRTIDAAGEFLFEPPIIGPGERGLMAYSPIQWTTNPLQFAGVLMSNRVPHQVGFFDPRYVHVNDLNLWWRIARRGPVAYSNKLLGGYRAFEGNHTSTLMRSGKNIQDLVDHVTQLIGIEAGESSRSIASFGRYYRGAYILGISQCYRFFSDDVAFNQTMDVVKKLPSAAHSRLHLFKLLLMRRRYLLSSTGRQQRCS